MIPDINEFDFYRILGRLEEGQSNLLRLFEDERELARVERRDSLERDERFERAERAFLDHIAYAKAVERQVLSNKAEIDKFKERSDKSEDLQRKVMGIFGLATFAFAMMLQGMWWALTHWSELGGFIKGLFKF